MNFNDITLRTKQFTWFLKMQQNKFMKQMQSIKVPIITECSKTFKKHLNSAWLIPPMQSTFRFNSSTLRVVNLPFFNSSTFLRWHSLETSSCKYFLTLIQALGNFKDIFVIYHCIIKVHRVVYTILTLFIF